ncbi:putative MATE family efflux protein [Pullulanibacillus pueri]|uniref:Putative multidrug resistance protein YpnP n=1 Tax=Pullulanibacillus pueri TaxID=1437324 RepID=A0A8J2ZU98_9BACL|nr:MATE family efflux transporter [Pullulanibacillus pueri]MBM7680722.1 putative MATE family efflux protein [Pullulanibacillus pueri]GGH78081.1 putative multidrug resistance protein YpnP [Pullulanibacillus pueri]
MAKQLDFTQGSLPKKMVSFAVPIFLTNILQASYQFIDSLWVGNLLGAKALAALAISGPVIFTVLSFIIGVNNATLTVLSQKKGAADEEGLKEALNGFVFVLGLFAIVLGILGILFAAPMLHLLGAPKDVLPLAVMYLRLNFTGILFLFGYNFISTVLRALGDSRSPIRFVFIAVVLNALLVPIFINGFNMGIEGAAFSTVIAQGVAFLYGLYFSIKRAKVPFSIPKLPTLSNFKLLMKLGLPSGLQMVAISGGSAAITSVAAHFGQGVLAGYGASQRLDNLIMIPIQTLGVAVTSMAGQNIGSKEWGRVSGITRYALIFNFTLSLMIGTLVFCFAPYLIKWFTNDPEAVVFGTHYLHGIAFFYPFLGINFVLNGVVRAAGAMFQILILNLISFWILRYPLAFLFGHWLGSGGMALGIGVSFMISSVFAIAYYWKGGWRGIRIFQEEN